MEKAGYTRDIFLKVHHYQSQQRQGIFNVNTCSGVVFNITFRGAHIDVRGPVMALGEKVKFGCKFDGGGNLKNAAQKFSKAQDRPTIHPGSVLQSENFVSFVFSLLADEQKFKKFAMCLNVTSWRLGISFVTPRQV